MLFIVTIAKKTETMEKYVRIGQMGACGPGEADFCKSSPRPEIHFMVANCLRRLIWLLPPVGFDKTEAGGGGGLMENFARLITNKDPAVGLTFGIHILGPGLVFL